jgi:hypothetical protein
MCETCRMLVEAIIGGITLGIVTILCIEFLK